MRTHRKVRHVILALLLLSPAAPMAAQDRGGIPTETQERMRNKLDPGVLWNVVGLLGLLGLLGLRKGHEEDSYHPASFE